MSVNFKITTASFHFFSYVKCFFFNSASTQKLKHDLLNVTHLKPVTYRMC